MVRHRRLVTAVSIWFAAVLGTTVLSTSSPPGAAGSPPATGASIPVSGSGGRLHLESLRLYLLGPGRSPGRVFFSYGSDDGQFRRAPARGRGRFRQTAHRHRIAMDLDEKELDTPGPLPGQLRNKRGTGVRIRLAPAGRPSRTPGTPPLRWRLSDTIRPSFRTRTPRTEIAITDKPGLMRLGFPANCSGPNFGEAVGFRFGLPPYGKTPSTPKMRCVAYLSPIATACL